MVAEKRQMNSPSSTSTAKAPPWLGAPSSATVRECLRLALLQQEEDRLTQLYLQTEFYKRATRELSGLAAKIILHALDGFLSEAGLRVEATCDVSNRLGGFAGGPAKTHLIQTAPGRYGYIVVEGIVFLRSDGGGRTILKIEGGKGQVDVSLLSNCLDEQDFFSRWEHYAYAHAYLRGQRFYASGQFVEMEGAPRLADVCLPDDARGLIHRMVLPFAEHSARFACRNLPAKRGLIFAGPPGTGKTMLCRALAAEVKATVIWASSRHFEGSAHNVAAIWDLARNLSPTMLILEDIDVFGEDRTNSHPSPVLGEIMNQMDGADDNSNILTLATTNRLDFVEQALRNRPGRFDRVIRFEGLAEPARRQLLTKLLVSDAFEPTILDLLTARSEGFTGARLMELVRTILELAYEGRPIGGNGSITVTPKLARKALLEVNGDRKKTPLGFMSEGSASGARK